jgi:hypothetical protein
VSLLTRLAFILHVAGGTVALLAGLVAISSSKGGRVHRTAGNVFVVSMVVMAAFADYLAVVMPDQLPNLIGGTFTIYLVATAWMTVWRPERTSGPAEQIALAVILLLSAPFAVLSFQLLTGARPFLRSAIPFEGPVLVAVYTFTSVMLLAAIGDLRMVVAGGVAGVRRILRHLWRMCFGLALAAGSAFTNGFPRLLPADVHVPLALLFAPQLAVLAVLVFWMLRVRFTGWYRRSAAPRVLTQSGEPG